MRREGVKRIEITAVGNWVGALPGRGAGGAEPPGGVGVGKGGEGMLLRRRWYDAAWTHEVTRTLRAEPTAG